MRGPLHSASSVPTLSRKTSNAGPIADLGWGVCALTAESPHSSNTDELLKPVNPYDQKSTAQTRLQRMSIDNKYNLKFDASN
jgi:hypothetical protein